MRWRFSAINSSAWRVRYAMRSRISDRRSSRQALLVSIINIARFPANLTVSGYARLCRRTQPAIPLIFCGP